MVTRPCQLLLRLDCELFGLAVDAEKRQRPDLSHDAVVIGELSGRIPGFECKRKRRNDKPGFYGTRDLISSLVGNSGPV